MLCIPHYKDTLAVCNYQYDSVCTLCKLDNLVGGMGDSVTLGLCESPAMGQGEGGGSTGRNKKKSTNTMNSKNKAWSPDWRDQAIVWND